MPFNPEGLSASDIECVMAMYDTFRPAVLSGDFDTLVELYTEDAIVMPPNSPPVGGRAAVKAMFESYPKFLAVDFTVDEIVGEGDLACVIGQYRMSLENPETGGTMDDVGSFIEVRERQEDGRWLLARDIFNSDLPVLG